MTSSEIETAIAELRAAVEDVAEHCDCEDCDKSECPYSLESPIETPYLRSFSMGRLFIAAKKLTAMPPVDVRRAPVQGGQPADWAKVPASLVERMGHVAWYIPPGSIPWADHLRVYAAYAARFGSAQSAERIAERQGFGIGEIVMLGCADVLERWEPR